jgi:excinuclease ABC subunit B
LDLPEVSLVAVLDADKEGFLRSDRSLTQTAGRAARNVDGRVIFYADKITNSMRRTMDETTRRRAKQMAYNEANGITPKGIFKSREEIIKQSAVLDIRGKGEGKKGRYYIEEEVVPLVADPVVEFLSAEKLQKLLNETKRKMEKAAKELDFMEAARLRDEMFLYDARLKDLKANV